MPYYVLSASTITGEIERHGIPVLYMLEPFRAKSGKPVPCCFQGQCKSQCTRLIRFTAESLASFLFQEKLIDCSAFPARLADWQWNKEKLLRDKAANEWKRFNRSYYLQLMFFQELRKLYPTDPWIASQLVSVYLGKRDWDNACNDYYKAAVSIPERFDAFLGYHRAICETHIRQKNPGPRNDAPRYSGSYRCHGTAGQILSGSERPDKPANFFIVSPRFLYTKNN